MAEIRRCDRCQKWLTHWRRFNDRWDFCDACAKPIQDFLDEYINNERARRLRLNAMEAQKAWENSYAGPPVEDA